MIYVIKSKLFTLDVIQTIMVRELHNCILTAVCEATLHVAEGGCMCTPCTPPKSTPDICVKLAFGEKCLCVRLSLFSNFTLRVYPLLNKILNHMFV